jgi:hypothetical protein
MGRYDLESPFENRVIVTLNKYSGLSKPPPLPKDKLMYYPTTTHSFRLKLSV